MTQLLVPGASHGHEGQRQLSRPRTIALRTVLLLAIALGALAVVAKFANAQQQSHCAEREKTIEKQHNA
jgi:hypothetical protein